MTSHPQQHLDIYKLPRESIDVEALAQELARYLQMAAEDSEVLSQDVTRRNELIGELYKRPGVEPYHPHNFVPPGGEPDAYLVPANAEIAKLTPPKSFEEHVERFHLIFPALMIFNRYKVGFALRDHPDLERKVVKRKRELMEEWRWNVFDVRFPGRIKAGPRPSSFKMPSTPSTPARIPQDQLDRADRGAWEVASYTVRKGDTGVEHEFQVLFDALGGDPLPMDEGEVRTLLRYSTLAV